MKLAIISDIHFPLEISRRTILYGNCGYDDSFYITLEEDLKSFSPDTIDVFIICGDFCWDYIYFQNDWGWNFNSPLLKMQELRDMLDARIPIIFIEGNHDQWFNTYIFSEDGRAWFKIEKFKEFLINTYRLDIHKVNEMLDQLYFNSENEIKIGENIHFLKNDGIIVKDLLIYGLPNYDKELLQGKYSEFKEDLVQNFNNYMEMKVSSLKDKSLPIKTILCQHVHPPEFNFVQAFHNPACDIKAFYWGHYHTIPQDYIDKLKIEGPYQCVMPEKNNLKLQIYEI